MVSVDIGRVVMLTIRHLNSDGSGWAIKCQHSDVILGNLQGSAVMMDIILA